MTGITHSSVPPLFAGLVDDAALFPPGNAPMEQAVPDHAAHRRAWYGSLVGPFLCTDRRLPELQAALGPTERIDVAVIVSGGAGAIEPAVTWVAQDERLDLRGLEIALRDEPDLGRNARRVALACDAAALDPEVTVSVEIPRGPDLRAVLEALDALAEAGHRAKLRTGGPDPDAVPSPTEIARFIDACLDREVPFKCTAGLHHAARHTDADGHDQHGFLDILLATRAALDGEPEAEVVRLLELRDAEDLAARVRALDEARVRSIRRWFTSFGSCSIAEPVADLVSMGLLEEPS